jgi:hypothetical protein
MSEKKENYKAGCNARKSMFVLKDGSILTHPAQLNQTPMAQCYRILPQAVIVARLVEMREDWETVGLPLGEVTVPLALVLFDICGLAELDQNQTRVVLGESLFKMYQAIQ